MTLIEACQQLELSLDKLAAGWTVTEHTVMS